MLVFFFGKRGRKTVRMVKTTAVAKYYGFGCRTIFSTEGSFGWAKDFPIGRSEKAFRIRRFMSKFPGVSLLSSASIKGRT